MADIGGARRVGRRWLRICAGIAAAGVVVAVVGIWHLPGWMYPGGGTEVAQARAALQSGLLTAAAALSAVAGGLIALDETRRANRDTHVRELYVEAAKLLNDPDNLGVRLAGIYAFERIAMDSPTDQRTVVEVLSAFVRERSHIRPSGLPRPPATDVQAALTVLGRLPPHRDVPRRADLTAVNLTGARLNGANLTGAWLGGANLTGALLVDANLTGARLDQVNLTSARLTGATLTDVRLVGANLCGAQLRKAVLANALLEGANLTDAVLAEADLSGAQLFWANLTGARGLTPEQVAVARGNAGTRLSDEAERPGSWPPYDPSE